MNETRFQSWVKIGTAIATTITAGSLLLRDWGPGNCFSPIRPALKGYLNHLFGVHAEKKDTVVTTSEHPQAEKRPS